MTDRREPPLFSVDYLDAKQHPAHSSLLGVVGLGVTASPAWRDPACPYVSLQLDLLAGAPYETWSVGAPVRYADDAGWQTAATDEILFASRTVDERGDIETATKTLYDALFDLLDQRDYPHLLRVWNYFPRITQDADGLERYRRFSVGRHTSFLQHGRAVEAAPAACAIGTNDGPLVLYLLASRTAGRPIENLRQVSAYRYPAQYGPKSPTFSRAMFAPVGGRDRLFISGTASIVGHESQHHGDTIAQAHETMANIDHLLTQATSHGPLRFKAYVRSDADLAKVRTVLDPRLGPDDTIVYVRGDICRAELLIEVEGVCLGQAA